MANKGTIFADRLTNLSLHNGLVRMDLGVFAGTGKTKDGKDAVKIENTHQIVMPLDAFVNAVASQQGMLKKLAEVGKKRRDAAAEAKELPAA